MEIVRIANPGQFHYTENGNKHIASFPLFLIAKAWSKGCDFEKEADGFGKGEGTKGDWSAIRDSTPEATDKMLEKAINFLFEE